MFFEKAIEKIKQVGFVKSDGQDDFEQFLIEERIKDDSTGNVRGSQEQEVHNVRQ